MMSLKELYEEVSLFLEKVDFENIWQGFTLFKYALYNDKEVYLNGNYIEKNDDFIGNTAVLYKNEMIAIFSVTEDIDPIVMTSKMVHEMFHGYQKISNESRFPNELDSLFNYQYTDLNLSIKLEENKLITELVDNFDLDKFNKLLRYRKYRFNHFKYEYEYESKIEQIEGTANFVELLSLKKLSNNKYQEKLNNMKKYIVNPNNLFPIRISCYDSGALLLYILKENNIPFRFDFNDTPFSIEILNLVDEELGCYELSMNAYINKYYSNIESVILKTIEKNDIIVDMEYEILGVNVYNATYYNHFIITTYFVMYGDSNNPHILYGDFLLQTNENNKLIKIYKI